MNVSGELINWFVTNGRILPWREEQDPYKIWLSEIILQQTRVNQGTGYYLRFLEKFPNVIQLAEAPVEEVLKLWQGLGYYTRARNLHKAAGIIVREHNGVFPSDFNLVRNLPGIGDYTAAAVTSFAFNLPFPAIDGNVGRVLSRLFGIPLPVNSAGSKKTYLEAAASIMDTKNPGLHNQAIMELGALICTPAAPSCNSCPVSGLCFAFQNKMTSIFPPRAKKLLPVDRYFYYLVITDGSNYFIRQRQTGDIWALLFEFPLIETKKPVSFESLAGHELWRKLITGSDDFVLSFSKEYRHKLTHQTIHAWFIRIEVKGYTTDGLIMVNDINRYPLHRLIVRYLNDYGSMPV